MQLGEKVYYQSYIAGIRYYTLIDIAKNIAEIYTDDGVARKLIDSFEIFENDTIRCTLFTMDYLVQKDGAQYSIVNQNDPSDCIKLNESKFEQLLNEYIQFLFSIRVHKEMLRKMGKSVIMQTADDILHIIIDAAERGVYGLSRSNIYADIKTRGYSIDYNCGIHVELALTFVLMLLPEYVRIKMCDTEIKIFLYTPFKLYERDDHNRLHAMLMDVIAIKAVTRSI